MKILRWLLGGFVFLIIAQVLGIVIYGVIFPKWYSIDTAPQFFRSMDSLGFKVGLPTMNFAQGLFISLVYALFYKGISGTTTCKKGTIFGFLLWLVGPLPGTLICFATKNMRFPLPCLIFTLLVTVAGSVIIAKIWGKSLEMSK